jgi:hypothetical protein
MNERIRELCEQATTFEVICGRGFDTTQYTEHFSKEKFAELIVREYEKLLPEICPWADADKEGPMKGWHVQFVARKHFGVEE